MTHPIAELTLATAIVVAIGAGTIAVLPRVEPAAPVTIALGVPETATSRAEPKPPRSDAERIEALQRQLLAIAAEQKRLTETVKQAARERKPR